jgi:hypothetical protein
MGFTGTSPGDAGAAAVGLIMRRKTAMKRTRAANEEGIIFVLGFISGERVSQNF